jgi:hypothetical protein
MDRIAAAIMAQVHLLGFRVESVGTGDEFIMTATAANGDKLVATARGEDAEYRCACDLAEQAGIDLEDG